MLKYLATIWKNNHGIWLLGMGIAAAIIMSCISYFNVLPDIEVIDELGQPQLAISPDANRTQINAVATGPKRRSEDAKTYKGYFWLIPHQGQLGLETQPSASEEFEFSSTGIACKRMHMPDLAEFALVAFIDLNENQQLDFGPSGLPAEPLRFINSAASPTTLDLNASSVPAASNPKSPVLAHFAFPELQVEKDTLDKILRSKRQP